MSDTEVPQATFREYVVEVVNAFVKSRIGEYGARADILALSQELLATKPEGFASSLRAEARQHENLGYAFDWDDFNKSLQRDFPRGYTSAQEDAAFLHAWTLTVIAQDYVPTAAPDNAFGGYLAAD